ncbi:MAB_1171c family putative transporter [Streptomyces sp. NPDC059740]|uniref:MAB_1171c family putative transporter n=1 Tax=Streptomyces sp. NPDC059740 TaxID=3346926 RepID=UPI00365225D7
MTFQLIAILLMTVGALWKGFDLLRAPYDRALRALFACLALLAVGESLSLPAATAAIDGATTTGVGKIVFNAIYMAGLLALIFFFTSAVRGAGRSSRLRRVNVALLAAVQLVSVAVMVATPAALRGHTLTTPDMGRVTIAAFYLVGNAYFVYAYLVSAAWALRYARRTFRHLRLGLWAMGLGLLGLTLTSLGRITWVFLRIDDPTGHAGFNTANWNLTNWSQYLVLLGVCCSGGAQLVARSRSYLHHRRLCRQLDPLWTALTAAYPELVLDRTPDTSVWRRLLQRRNQEQRFYRRVIECRDGLVRISPYLARVAPDEDLERGSADRLAQHLPKAVAMKAADQEADPAYTAVRISSPVGNDLAADARELITLSNALRERTA